MRKNVWKVKVNSFKIWKLTYKEATYNKNKNQAEYNNNTNHTWAKTTVPSPKSKP